MKISLYSDQNRKRKKETSDRGIERVLLAPFKIFDDELGVWCVYDFKKLRYLLRAEEAYIDVYRVKPENKGKNERKMM